MSEFSASVLLEAEVDQSSLRSARTQIEDDLGSVPVSATDQIANSGSNGGANTTAILEDNLDLDQERNSLLKDLVDAQEMTARSGGDGGLPDLLRTGARGAMMISGGGAALVSILAGVNWTRVMSEAIPDIKPSDVIDKTKVTADDLIDDAAEIGREDVVDQTVQATDIVGDAFPVGMSQIVASSPLVTAAALIAGEELPVKAADIVGSELPATLTHVIGEDLPAAAADVVKDDLPVGVETILASTPLLSIGAILSDAFPLSPSDIFGSGDPSGDSSPSGDGGGGDLPILEVLGGGAFGAGLFKALGGSGALSRILGTSSGAALFTPEMFEDTAFGDLTTDPEDVDSDKPTLAEIVTGAFSGNGGSEGSTIDGVTVDGTTTDNINIGEWVSSIQQNQTGQPQGMQLETVTVGGDGSNRNETSGGRDGQLEFTGSIDHNVTVTQDFERDIKKQLRRNGVPRALIDAILDELDREVR